jgi:hypothetical protein
MSPAVQATPRALAAVENRSVLQVAVPNDPVNLQRALRILRDLGLIEIRNSEPVDVTELDIIKNPGGIKIVPLEAAQAPRAIEDVDFAVIQGNFAIYSGLKLTNAFALTYIVGSTRIAVEVGDQRWRELLDRHDRLAKQTIEKHRGNFVKKARATVFSQPSTDRAAWCVARSPLAQLRSKSVSLCGPAYTPAKSRCGARMSAGSQCTPPRA